MFKARMGSYSSLLLCLLKNALIVSFLQAGIVNVQGQTTAAAATTTSSSETYPPAALQTGPDYGSSFAAAAVYHPGLDAVLLVGTTYGNAFQPHSTTNNTQGCFFALVKLPDAATTSSSTTSSNSNSTGFHFLEQQTLQIPNTFEVCTNVLLHGDRILVSGYAGKGGLLDPLYVSGGYQEASQVGMILDLLELSGVEGISDVRYTFVGGHLLQESTIAYPVALTALGGDSVIYAASMETEIATRNIDIGQQQSSLDMVQDPTSFLAVGDQFYMTVKKIIVADSSSLNANTQQVQETLQDSWRVHIATKQGESVHVASIQKMSDSLLIVVGTTAGTGPSFGRDAGSSTTDLDGFITKLSPTNGAVVGDWNNASNPSAVKVASANDRDDWIAGMCYNPRDPHHIYVVGSTHGIMDATKDGSQQNNNTVQAFLIKYEVERLIPVWTHQLGAYDIREATSVKGISCAVTPDGNTIYYGGVVENGAVLELSGPSESYGGDDIFVAQLDTATGTMAFVRQIGSERNDELATRGGLVTDKYGNAIVVGNTFGSLYRQRNSDANGDSGGRVADVFVATISRFNGNVVVPIRPAGTARDQPATETTTTTTTAETAPTTSISTSTTPNTPTFGVETTASSGPPNGDNIPDIVEIPGVPINIVTNYSRGGDTNAAGGGSAVEPEQDPDSDDDESSKGNALGHAVRAGLGIGIFFGVLGICIFVAVALLDKGEPETDRSKVLDYLGEFNVDNVDLRHSATGGWHCSYSGPLAQGIFIGKKKARRGSNLSVVSSSSVSRGGVRNSSSNNNATSPLATASLLEENIYDDERAIVVRGSGGRDGRGRGGATSDDDDDLSIHTSSTTSSHRTGPYTNNHNLVDEYNQSWNELAAQVSQEALVASSSETRGEWRQDII